MNNNFHVQRQYFPTFQYSQKKLEEGTQDSRQHHFRRQYKKNVFPALKQCIDNAIMFDLTAY
jgi:hypothetical protein